jgi:hypothetical protein
MKAKQNVCQFLLALWTKRRCRPFFSISGNTAENHALSMAGKPAAAQAALEDPLRGRHQAKSAW